jgi:hypothetical protein
MDMVAIRAALGTWFSAVTGLRAQDREGKQDWGGTFNPSYSGAPVSAEGKLHVAVIGTLGVDRRRFEYDDQEPQGSEIIPHVEGQRMLLWEVQIESLSQEAGEDAPFYLNRVRDLLHAPSAITAFSGVQLGVREISDNVDLTLLQNNRRVSLAQMDVMFNACTDVTDAAFGYVNRFDVTSDWKDSEGNSLPADLQMSGEIVI